MLERQDKEIPENEKQVLIKKESPSCIDNDEWLSPFIPSCAGIGGGIAGSIVKGIAGLSGGAAIGIGFASGMSIGCGIVSVCCCRHLGFFSNSGTTNQVAAEADRELNPVTTSMYVL